MKLESFAENITPEEGHTETPASKDSLFGKAKKSLKRTVALGAAIGAGYLGSGTDAQATENGPDGTSSGNGKISHVEKSEQAERFDAAYIMNFVTTIKKEASVVAQGNDNREYIKFVEKVEAFQIKASFAGPLSPTDKDELIRVAKELQPLLKKIDVRITEVATDMQQVIDDLSQRKIEGTAYGIDLNEGKQMRIAQDVRIIKGLKSLQGKIHRIEGHLDESIK